MTKDHEYIKAHYGKEKTRDIALHLGRSDQYVRCAARRMGLRKQTHRAVTKPCGTCLLAAPNGHCIYSNEGEAERCRVMRFSTAEWPRELTPMEILFENI